MSSPWSRLIESLTGWLDEIAPPQVSISVIDDRIVVRDNDGLGTVVHIGQLLGPPTQAETAIERALISTLSSIQDFIVESTGEVWPRDMLKGDEYLPMPDAAVEASSVRAWYGERQEPTQQLVLSRSIVPHL
jgi:hypothetical protein